MVIFLGPMWNTELFSWLAEMIQSGLKALRYVYGQCDIATFLYLVQSELFGWLSVCVVCSAWP